MFTIMYGKQTFGDVTDMVSVFAFPLADGVPWASKISLNNSSFTKASVTTSSYASTDGYKEHGSWYQTSYNFSNTPTAVCVLLHRRVRSVTRAQCALHVIPDPSAGHITVQAPLTRNSLSRFGGLLPAFSGCGYVVRYGNLKTFGIVITKAETSTFFDQEEINEEFTVAGSSVKNELPEVLHIPKDDGGSTLVFVKPTPTRKMRVRPK